MDVLKIRRTQDSWTFRRDGQKDIRKRLYSVALFLTVFRSFAFSECRTYTLLGEWNRSFVIVFTLTAYLLLGIKFLLDLRESFDRRVLFVGLLTLFALAVEYHSQGDWIWDAWLFILCGRGMTEEDIAKPAFSALLVSVIPTVALAGLGVIVNLQLDGGNGSPAYAIGFSNPNTAAIVILNIAMLALYLFRKKKLLAVSVLCGLVLCVVWKVTNSRTACLALALMIAAAVILAFFQDRFERCGVLVQWAIFAGFAVLFGVAVVSLVFAIYPNTFLDKLLSGRFELAGWFVRHADITLLGHALPAEAVQLLGHSLDMGYLHLVLKYGIVYSAIFCALYGGMIIRAARKKEYLLLALICVILLTGLTETAFFRWRYNFTFFFLAPVVWDTCDRKTARVFAKVLAVFCLLPLCLYPMRIRADRLMQQAKEGDASTPFTVSGAFVLTEDGCSRTGSDRTQATDYIAIEPGSTVYAENIDCHSGVGICEYDREGQFIQAVPVGNYETETAFRAGKDTYYIRLTYQKDAQPVLYTVAADPEVTKLVQTEEPVFRSGSYIQKQDGSVAYDLPEYASTGFIPVSGGQTYRFLNSRLSDGAAIYAYDKHQQPLAYLICEKDGLLCDITLTENTGYIRISQKQDNIGNFSYYQVISDPEAAEELAPALTLIDDDTLSQNAVEDYHSVCEDLGVKGCYAVITDRMNHYPQLKDTLLQYQAEGYGLLMHCRDQNPDAVYFKEEERDIAACEENLLEGRKAYDTAGFLNGEYWVTPYGVHDEEIQELCRRSKEACLISTANQTSLLPDGTRADGQTASPYDIPRWSFRPQQAEEDSVFGRSELRHQLYLCAAQDGWFILATSFYDWGDTAEEQQESTRYFRETVRFAQELGFEVKTFAEVFRQDGGYLQ